MTTRRRRAERPLLELRRDEPWTEAVDGSVLVREIADFQSRYVVLPPGGLPAVTMWTISTYLMPAFDSHPLLVFSSPDRRCGKSRALEILESLVFRPVRTAGVSEAALYRIVATAAPTLLIDEAQNLRQRDERSAALHDLLCAANRRGAFVLRVGGPDRDRVEQFPIFGPKALAAIGSLASVVMDRAIQIPMRRRKPDEQIAAFFFGRAEAEAAPIRRRIVRWAADHHDLVADIYRSVAPPAFLQDREAESWSCLFAVGAAADAALLPTLGEAARLLTGAKLDAVVPAAGVRLLADLQQAFDEAGEERLATRTLLESLTASPEWAEWRRGRPLTEKALADLLRPFRVRPVQWRVGDERERGYRRADFQDAWERYQEFAQPVTVTDRDSPKPAMDAAVTGVTDQTPIVGIRTFPEQVLAAVGIPADDELLEVVARSAEEVRRSPERLPNVAQALSRALQARGFLIPQNSVHALLSPLVQQAVAIFNGEIVDVQDAPLPYIAASPVTTRDTQFRRGDSLDLRPVTSQVKTEVHEAGLKW